ncbi:hypothetical protein [Agromyces mangrovi Wang et al. 2018]|uniref:hypothetical protein n=1 Tax=Agromyces mangrovi TaxID=1858653 RepID=UPI0025737C38|nr:hypothetical protein [Agromyces mangrovi]BDZ64747.1 hypothetical protein GCM10025877_16850 [Agromyces mangrovi]
MPTAITPAELRSFITHTEGSVTPKGVAGLYGRAEMLARMPQSLQRWIVDRASSSADEYMGFIVEPYAFFLAYEITDTDAAERLLPEGYRLVPTAMFADEAPRHCAILGAFNVRASVFQGARVELYVIAESIRTGLLTWVICDYESNTINYDPGEGFSAATTERAIVTTAHTGDVIVDVRSAERPNAVAATASVPAGTMHPLDQRLWVEGNLSVDYGGRLAHEGSEPFGLVFDPAEMAQALRIPLDAAQVEANTFGAEWRADAPFEVACFPYAQHFLTTNYPRSTPIHDEHAVAEAVRAQVSAAV